MTFSLLCRLDWKVFEAAPEPLARIESQSKRARQKRKLHADGDDDHDDDDDDDEVFDALRQQFHSSWVGNKE